MKNTDLYNTRDINSIYLRIDPFIDYEWTRRIDHDTREEVSENLHQNMLAFNNPANNNPITEKGPPTLFRSKKKKSYQQQFL